MTSLLKPRLTPQQKGMYTYLTVRISKEDKKRIQLLAIELGISLSTYVERLILGSLVRIAEK